jgi:hypothetical protein
MNTSLQPKKLSSRPKSLNKSDWNVLQRLEQNDWNPFERVNPKVLEILNRRNKRTPLDDVGESPI